jgi:hypothetical protein
VPDVVKSRSPVERACTLKGRGTLAGTPASHEPSDLNSAIQEALPHAVAARRGRTHVLGDFLLGDRAHTHFAPTSAHERLWAG